MPGTALAVSPPRRRPADTPRRPARPAPPSRRPRTSPNPRRLAPAPRPVPRSPGRPPSPLPAPFRPTGPIVRAARRFNRYAQVAFLLYDWLGPAAIPATPNGAASSAACGAPRDDLLRIDRGWVNGGCATWIAHATNCLQAQAGSPGDVWLPARETLITSGMYRITTGYRWQVLQTNCYPEGSFGRDPIAPYATPRPAAFPFPVNGPGPVRDALYGRYLPHGRDVADNPFSDNDFVELPPGMVIVVRHTPNGRTRYDVKPAPRGATRPQPGTPRVRERKGKWQKTAGIMLSMLSAFSEGRDFIEVVWKSIPRQYRRAKRHQTHAQIVEIFQNMHRIELDAFVQNYVLNELEDQLVGRAIGRISDRYGSDVVRKFAQQDSYAVQGLTRNRAIENAAWALK